MSEREWDRYKVLQEVKSKRLTQIEAAHLLGITDRQIRNLLKIVKLHGKAGIISKHKGRPSNNRKPQNIRDLAIKTLRSKYEGFGPTFAKEKLEEINNIKISKETLRQWMIEAHLWVPRASKRKVHLPRNRRSCFGELIQADGSHHRWFGDDMPPVNLNVFIDDATSKLTSLVFSEGETLDSYFFSLEQHLKRYGRPRALYTDRFTVFYSSKEHGITHMQKALKELDIELILANSPQAKGRVERANRTLQDRLLKELRIRGITTIEAANLFAQEFIKIYNEKFSKEPMNDFDAHQPLEGYDLERILCRFETRTLLSDCTFQFNNRLFKVQDLPDIKRAKGRKIEIRITKNDCMRVFFKDQELKVRPLGEIFEDPPELSRKEVLCRKPRGGQPSRFHPWKHWGKDKVVNM